MAERKANLECGGIESVTNDDTALDSTEKPTKPHNKRFANDEANRAEKLGIAALT